MTTMHHQKPSMTLTQAANKYGQSRNNISVGDSVLYERSDTTHGTSVVLAEVAAVAENVVKLRTIGVYDGSGNFLSETYEIEVTRDYFKDSLLTRLQWNNDLFKDIVDQLQHTE